MSFQKPLNYGDDQRQIVYVFAPNSFSSCKVKKVRNELSKPIRDKRPACFI